MAKRYPIQDLFDDLDIVNLDDYKRFEGKFDYIIAITPRVGSTALCSLLEKSNIIGKPKEFFNPRGPVQNFKKTIQSNSFVDYLDEIISSYGADYFGFKTAWLDFEFFTSTGLDSVLFKGSNIIYIDRIDIIAQTISLYHAMATSKYHYKEQKVDATSVEYEYNLDEIKGIKKSIEQGKLGWRKYLRSRKISSLELVYEEFQSDLPLVAERIFNFLSIPNNINWKTFHSDFVKAEKPLYELWLAKTKSLIKA